jgi:hypothetical protein
VQVDAAKLRAAFAAEGAAAQRSLEPTSPDLDDPGQIHSKPQR